MLYQHQTNHQETSFNLNQLKSTDQDNLIQYLKKRLQKVLDCLEEEKLHYYDMVQREQKQFMQKLQQKDQVIEKLLKSIYSFKMENSQLRFQYERKIKLIKEIDKKYQKLLTEKDTKINHLQSVILYLQNKILKIEKPFAENSKETDLHKNFKMAKVKKIQIQNNFLLNIKQQMKKSCVQSLRNLQVTEQTIPLKRSHLSATSKNSSSPSHTRLKINQYNQKRKNNEDCISFFQVQEDEDANSSDIFEIDINLGNKKLQPSSKTNFNSPKLKRKSEQTHQMGDFL